MYKNVQVYYPRNIYLNLNFDIVKKKLKSNLENYDDYKDHGSIVIITFYNSIISINDIGKVNLFSNIDGYGNSYSDFDKVIKIIEASFKELVPEFSLQH